MDEQLLKDFLATVEKYNYDYDVVMPKFPELQGYDLQLLKDYAATAQKYNYDYSVINPKFPEFKLDGVPALKKKEETLAPTGSDLEASGQPATGTPASESDLTSQPSEPSELPYQQDGSSFMPESQEQQSELKYGEAYLSPESQEQQSELKYGEAYLGEYLSDPSDYKPMINRFPAYGQSDLKTREFERIKLPFRAYTDDDPKLPQYKGSGDPNQVVKADQSYSDITLMMAENLGMSPEDYMDPGKRLKREEEIRDEQKAIDNIKKKKIQNDIEKTYVETISKEYDMSEEDARENLPNLALYNLYFDPEGTGLKLDPIEGMEDFDIDDVLEFRASLANKAIEKGGDELIKKVFVNMVDKKGGDVEAAKIEFEKGMEGIGEMFLSDDLKKVRDLRKSIIELENTPIQSEASKEMLRIKRLELKKFTDQGNYGANTLFDPKTGQYVSGNTKDPEIISFNKEMNKKVKTYENTDVGKLKKRRDDLYFQYQNFVHNVMLDQDISLNGLARENYANIYGLTTPTDSQGLNAEFTKDQKKQIAIDMYGSPYNFHGWDLGGKGDMSDAFKIMNSDIFGDEVTMKAQLILADFMAVNRALKLNEDPAGIEDSKGFERFFTYAGKGFKEVMGGVSQADEVVAERTINQIKSLGYDIPLSQMESLKKDFTQELGEAAGASIPLMGEIMLDLALVNKVAGVAKIPKLIETLSRGNKFAKFGLDLVYEAASQGAAFEMAGEGFIGGAGEGVGQFLVDAVLKKFKVNNRMLSILSKSVGGALSETAAEYTGQFVDELSKNNVGFDKAVERTFGKTAEDAMEKFALTYLISQIYGTGTSTVSTFTNPLNRGVDTEEQVSNEEWADWASKQVINFESDSPIVNEIKKFAEEQQSQLSPVQKTEIESIIEQQKQGPQKADIERIRQEELSILDAKQAESEKTGEIPTDENGNAINIKEEKQKINSKYDAALAVQEQDNINQQKQTTDEVQESQEGDVSTEEEVQKQDVEPTEEGKQEIINPSQVNPSEITQRNKEAEARLKKEGVDNLFIGANLPTGSNEKALPVSVDVINDIAVATYANEKTGLINTVISGFSENNFVGYYRIYENGKPTNKWSSKFENQNTGDKNIDSKKKDNFKTMISSVQERLPSDHLYTEKTSISTDGLRVWGNQIDRGTYEFALDEKGFYITNRVSINGDALVNELGIDVKQGDFQNIKVRTEKEFNKVKEALLPYLEKLRLNENNIYWTKPKGAARLAGSTVEIDLPVLKPVQTEVKPKVTTEEVVITPENSSNYANMTEDGEGNFVFYHVGGDGYETIKPSSGKGATSKTERAALSKVGGLAMYYTSEERGVKDATSASGTTYAVKVPKEKVYDINNDPLNLKEEARKLHAEEHAGKAFDANTTNAYVTKLAAERGFEMAVGQWNNTTRAQSIKELAPSDMMIVDKDNYVKKSFDNKYRSNKDKGFESIVPETKEERLQSVYEKANKERNKQGVYDDLYHLYSKPIASRPDQDAITEMINNSDLPQEIKDEYAEVLEYEPEKRRSKLNVEEVKTDPVDIESSPSGTFVNVGMIKGTSGSEMTSDEILSALPKDVKVIQSTRLEIGENVDEPTLSLELSRPLTDGEMKNLRSETEQLAVPQMSDGKGVMYGTLDWGDFNSEYFVMPNKSKLSEYTSDTKVENKAQEEVEDDVIPEATEGALDLLDAFGKKPKKSKVTPKKRKQVLDQVAKAEKALSKISPKTKIVVHETSKDYKSSGRNRNQNEGGVYEVDAEGNGTIHINLEAANERTVAHEVFHALLLSKGMGDKQAQAITNRMLEAVKKTASPELLAELERFSKEYVLEDENGNPILDKNGNTIPDPVQSEESIAELFGILASEYDTLPRPTQNIIKRWLDKLAKLFGLKLFTDNEVVDMLNTVSRSVREGSVIEESDIDVIRRDPMLARDTRADFLGGIPVDELTDADLDQNQTRQWSDGRSQIGTATRKQITEESIKNSVVSDISADYTYVFDDYGREIVLPKKETVKNVLEKSGGYAVFINSDGTKVGVRSNGELLDGGWQYTFIKENVDSNIGFAATSETHVKTLHKMVSELTAQRDSVNPESKGKPIAVFVTVQNGETMLGEWYAGEYFFEGIDKAITENKFKNGVDTFRKLMTDALSFKSKINESRKKIRELKKQNQTNETKSKIEALKNRVIRFKKKASSRETVALLKLINSDKFKTHDGRIEIAKEFASKKFTFGFRVNLLKSLIPLKSATGGNKIIKKALLDVDHGRQEFYQEHLDGSLLNRLEETSYDETSIGGVTLGGFYMDPYVSKKKFFENRKNGIDHAQFNESFSSNGETFRLDKAHDVNKLNPYMGYPTANGYKVYNKENGTNINKKNASIKDRHDIVAYLDNKYGNKKDGKNLFALPFTSIGGSMYTPTDSEIEFNDSPKKPSRRRKQINPNKRTDRLAPNGNRSNLTNSQYDSVRTPEFKKWFGDWENNPEGASKVVDENGEPLVVYHGSVSTDINEFDRGMSKRKSSGLKEFGTYFTTNEDLAKLYASTEMSNEGKQDKAKKINTIKKKLQSVRNNKEYEALDRELRLLSKDNRIYPVFLNLKKMEVFDAKEDTNIEAWKNLEVKASYKLASGRDAMDFLKEGKFGVQKVDGIKAENIIDMSIGGAYKGSDSYQKAKDKYLSDVYLVFDNQGQNIKLADGTNTTFNPQSRDIRKQKPSDDRPSIEAVREKAKQLGISEKDTEIALRNMGYTNAEIKADKNKSDPFEEEMRGLRKDLGKKEKKSPSKKKILGEPKDKKVTMTERSALKSQIRMEARAARGAVKSYKDASKDLIDHIKELSKTGVIKSSQASVMIKKVLGTNMLNKKAVDKMISYIDKVYSNAELAAMIQAARKLSTQAKKNLRGKVGPSKSMQSVLENLFSLDPTMVPMDVFDTYVDLLNQFGKRKAVLDLEESSVVLDKATKVLDAVEESIKETEISETGETEISETDKTTSNEEEVDFDKYAEDVLSEEISMDNLDSKEAKDLAAYLNKLTKKDLEALVTEKKDGSKSYAMLENLRGVKKNMTNGFVPSVALRIKTMVESKKSADKIKSVVESKVKNFNPLTMMSRGYGIIKGKLTGKRSMTESVRGNNVFSIDDILGNFNDKSIHDNTFRKLSTAYSAYQTDMEISVKSKLDAAEKLLHKKNKFLQKLENKVQESKYKLQAYRLQREFESNPESSQVVPAVDFINETIRVIKKDKAGTTLNKNDIRILEKIKEDFGTDGQIDLEKIEKSMTSNEKKALKLIDEASNLQSKALWTSAVIRGEKIKPINNYVHHNVKTDSDAETVIEKAKGIMNPSTKAGTLNTRTPGVKAINFDPISSTEMGARQTLLDYHMTESVREVSSTLSQLQKMDYNTDTQQEAINAIDNTVRELLEATLNSQLVNSSALDVGLQKTKKLGYQAALASVPRAAAELGSNLMYAMTKPKEFVGGVKEFGRFSIGSRGIEAMNNLGSSETMRLYDTHNLTGKMTDSGVLATGARKTTKTRSEIEDKIRYLNNLGPKQVRGLATIIADALISTPDKAVSRPMWFGTFASEFKKLTGETISSKEMDKIADGTSKYLDPKYNESVKEAAKIADRELIKMSSTNNPFNSTPKNLPNAADSALKTIYKSANTYMASFMLNEFGTARNAVLSLFEKGDMTKGQAAASLIGIQMRMASYMILYSLTTGLFYSMFGVEEEEEDIWDLIKRQMLGAPVSLITGGSLGNIPRIPINYAIEKFNENFLEGLRSGEEYDPYKHSLVFSQISEDDLSKKSPEELAIKMFAGPYSPLMSSISRAVTVYNRAESSKKEETRKKYEDEWDNRIKFEALGNLGYIPFYKDIRRIMLKNMFKDKKKK